MPNKLELDEFSCAICLEMLHKPAINHCGHCFCFWCFHHAMGGLGASQCPLCRAPFKHFAAVCAPLHAYLQLTFPEVAAERDAATKVQEKTEWNAESPDLPPPDSSASPLAGFLCVGCGQVAAPPAILTCGHVVCARTGVGWSGCPVDGCVGTAPGGSLAVCGLVASILRAEYDGYEEALARGCRAPAAVPSGATAVPSASETGTASTVAADPAGGAGEEVVAVGDAALLGAEVELHSLSSAAGSQLNGRRGMVEGFDATTQRYVVMLPRADEGAAPPRRVNARGANLRVVRAARPYIHFGRGCDGCGAYPIEGRCYRCAECAEAIGYDVCGECYDRGVHARAAPSGRFNQAHLPTHRMEEVEQVDTVLHMLQRAHPHMSIDELMAFVSAHTGAEDDAEVAQADAGGNSAEPQAAEDDAERNDNVNVEEVDTGSRSGSGD